VSAPPRAVGRPSPEGVHRDGFPFISIHLIGLRDVRVGGVTHLVRPSGEPVATHRISQPLDSVYLDDAALLHVVTPIVAGTGVAHRDVLLMSYRPAG
jgi:hypothetical protein